MSSKLEDLPDLLNRLDSLFMWELVEAGGHLWEIGREIERRLSDDGSELDKIILMFARRGLTQTRRDIDNRIDMQR